jgi:hypothetical protein
MLAVLEGIPVGLQVFLAVMVSVHLLALVRRRLLRLRAPTAPGTRPAYFVGGSQYFVGGSQFRRAVLCFGSAAVIAAGTRCE